MKKFTADFETTTDPEDCRVWAYALCQIGDFNNFIYGNSIDDFIDFCMNKKENYVLFFHNLKFDGEFIFNYLLTHGYTYIKDKKDRKTKTFTCLISGMGAFYSIEIYFDCSNIKKVNKVTIYDSLKILNFSVDEIAKKLKLPIQKLELNYTEKRKKGHQLTQHEIDYIKNDVTIMAMALNFMFNEKLTKMTIGSDALSYYKSINKNFKSYYPELNYNIDKDIRQSYRGGFTYLNPIYKDKIVSSGVVLDVNSLYPSVMKYERLPIGEPMFFTGKYEEDSLYNLYVQMISCSFVLKPGKIPTIQIKNNLSYISNEYLESSKGDIVTLCLTSVDLKLFFENYNVYDLSYISGWKFKSVKGLFTDYIDYWTEKKIQAKKDNNSVLYLIAKLMLNSLYGKFGLNPEQRSKFPSLDFDGSIKYNMLPLEIRKPIYIPTATFITAYARYKTITTSQSIRDYSIAKYGVDMYLYSDTDSIHTLLTNNEELKSFVDIDDYKLGAWKIESSFIKAKFIRQKCYIEQNEDHLNVTVAGLPKKLAEIINFDNFKGGFTTEDIPKEEFKNGKKLTFKHVKGGVILVDTDFTIKEG